MLYDRLDLLLVRAVSEEAHAQHLPLAIHTGDARDVADAVEIGSSSVEHGSMRDEIPGPPVGAHGEGRRLSRPDARRGRGLCALLTAVSPICSIIRWCSRWYPARVLKGTREFVGSGKGADPAKAELFARALDTARTNLLRAWQAGVPLVMGSDSGNPMVFHGPSLHHELQLWVQAGIPVMVALQAATVNAAKLLGAAEHIGAIRQGMDANLLLVDGNPLQEVAATERISLVVFKGERIRRAALFEQK